MTSPDEDIQRLIVNLRRADWKFAKTYAAFMPHWYTVGKKWQSIDDFKWTAQAIVTHGRHEQFFKSQPSRRYFYVDGWRYWIMDPDPADAEIINRERQDIRRPIWSE